MAAMASAPASTASRRASTSRSGDSESNMSMVPSSCMARARWTPAARRGWRCRGPAWNATSAASTSRPALGAADHLEGLALHGRLAGRAGSLEGGPGEGDRDVGLGAPHGGVGGQRVGRASTAASARRQHAGGGGVRLGVVPPAGGQVDAPEHEVHLGRGRGVGGEGEELAPSSAARSVCARLRAGTQQHPVGRRARVAGRGVAGSGGERLGRASEPSSRARSAASSQSSAARSCCRRRRPAGRRAGSVRRGGQGRRRGAAASARAASVACSAGQRGGQHGVAGEGVAEPEAGALHVDELRPHRLPQQLGGLVVRPRRRRGGERSSRTGGRAGRRR